MDTGRRRFRGAAYSHRRRSGYRRVVRPQSLEHRFRPACRLCRLLRAADILHRRPPGLPRPQCHARPADRPVYNGRTAKHGRRRARSLRCPADRAEPAGERHAGGGVPAGANRHMGRFPGIDRQIPGSRSRRRIRCRQPPVGRHSRHCSGENTRSCHGHHAESLAAVPNARLPRLGPGGVLPGQWRLRVPRSIARRDGAVRRPPCGGTCPGATRRGAPIRAGRCSALVVAGKRQGHPHTHFR